MPGKRQFNAKWGLLVLCLLLSRIALCNPAFAADRRQEILDQPEGCVITDSELIAELQALYAEQDTVVLQYPRFEVLIDSAYYEQSASAIIEYFEYDTSRSSRKNNEE